MTSFVPDHAGCNPEADAVPSGAAGLRATVSLLKDVADNAEATLNSLSAFLHSCSDVSASNGAAFSGDSLLRDTGFCRCPYDPRHRMPPDSLFCHSLRCSSAPGGSLLDLGFLETMRYPSSFKSEAELLRENIFFRPFPDSGADLCYSLEKDVEDVGCSSFFYRDCPGVVTNPEPDVSARTFTLPGALSVECANFICSNRERDNYNGVLGRGNVSILPSDFWVLKREVEAWKDYPEGYSYTAARVASCLRNAGDFGLRKWIISSSPRFGILIDTAMRDHIFLLLKLCLKTIWHEASDSLVLLSSNGEPLDLRSLCFRCPCLFQTLTWLASQLCILYGETHGKAFAIGMVAESLLSVGSKMLLFPFDEDSNEQENNGNRQEISGTKLDADVTDGDSKSVVSEDIRCSENFCQGQIFVSQVAAAVAALHERSLLEDRVKQLRFPQLLPRYQLLDEHLNVSLRANEVRAKRPNYRPIVENDGLLWQKPQNQDMARTKTREELLAEMRDYKRRRMSYRAKKVKRTTTQVIRDIIEEHMEEIKQAGGIGCNMKGSTDAEMLIPDSSSQGDISADAVKSKKSEPYGASIRDSFANKKLDYLEFDVTASMLEDAYKEDSCSTDCYSKVRWERRYVDHQIQDNSEKTVRMGEHINHDYRRYANYRSLRQSNDRHAHRREKGGKEVSRSKYDKRDSLSSHSIEDYTASSSLSSSSMVKEEYNHTSERINQSMGGNHDSCRSVSVTEITFEDRYEPYNTFEDVSANVSSRKKYNLTTDPHGCHDPRRHHHSNKKHEHEKM